MSNIEYSFQRWEWIWILIWMLVGTNFLVKFKPAEELIKHRNLLKLGCNSTQIPNLNPEEMKIFKGLG